MFGHPLNNRPWAVDMGFELKDLPGLHMQVGQPGAGFRADRR